MVFFKIFGTIFKPTFSRKNSNFPLLIENAVFQYMNLLFKLGGILIPNRLLRSI